MQFLSYILSITLHLGLILGAFFWADSTPPKIQDTPVLISLVEGEIGGNKAPTPILGAAGNEAEKIAPSLPTKETKAIPIPQAKKPEPPKEVKPIEQPKKPEPKKPEPKLPEPKKLPKPEPKPEPKKEMVKPEVKKEEPKAKPKQEKAKESKQDKKTTETKPKAKPQSKPKAKPQSKPKPKPKIDPGAKALAEAKRNAGGFKGGGGGQGSGTGGGSLNNVYIGQVMMAVRPNWDFESATRTNFIAHVRVKINAQGQVLSATLEQSSGNGGYDASTVNAVLRTAEANMFPLPPSSAYHDLILVFTRDMMK